MQPLIVRIWTMRSTPIAMAWSRCSYRRMRSAQSSPLSLQGTRRRRVQFDLAHPCRRIQPRAPSISATPRCLMGVLSCLNRAIPSDLGVITDSGIGRAFGLIYRRTMKPNALVACVPDRMPVILSVERLGAEPAEAARLIGPALEDALVATAVGKRVNSVKNDDPACERPRDHRRGRGHRQGPGRQSGADRARVVASQPCRCRPARGRYQALPHHRRGRLAGDQPDRRGGGRARGPLHPAIRLSGHLRRRRAGADLGQAGHQAARA